MKKTTLLGLWILVGVLIVVAVAPSIPTTLSPDDNTDYFGIPQLTCSGFTDDEGDNTFVEYYINHQLGYFDQITSNSGWSTGAGAFYNGERINTTDCGDCYLENVTIATGDAKSKLFIYTATSTVPDKLIYDISISGGYAVVQNNLSSNTSYWFLFGDNNVTSQTYAYKEDATSSCKEQNYTIKVCGENNEHMINMDCNSCSNRVQSAWGLNFDPNASVGVSLIGNSTSSSVNYSGIINGQPNTWVCRACDNTSLCSNFTTQRSINSMEVTKCDSGNIALNLSFFNESNSVINLSSEINAMALEFDSDDTPDYTYNYTNITENAFYSFCLDPDNTSLTTTGTIPFKADGFPQRTYSLSDSLNGNTTLNIKLYLLGIADGIYVTFQVIDTANSPIEDVRVAATKTIGGSSTEVASGTTDSAGAVTLWLDPDTSHIFTFTRTGYTTLTEVITPTQSTYTITMASTSDTFNGTNYQMGIWYDVTPNEMVLNNNTDYNFGFNITSSNLTLSTYGFTLKNSTGFNLGSATGSTGNGSYVNQTINTGNQSEVTMEYYWINEGNNVSGTHTWQVRSTYQGAYSFMTFFDDLKSFSNSGFNDFTRSLIAFGVILLLVAIVSFVSGINSPFAIISMIVMLTWLFEFVDLIGSIGVKYFTTAMMMLLGIGYWIYDNVK